MISYYSEDRYMVLRDESDMVVILISLILTKQSTLYKQLTLYSRRQQFNLVFDDELLVWSLLHAFRPYVIIVPVSATLT